ncbi:MAG: type IX secretion system sortase PorU [Muribaculaceae bacterium]|nr:type IX secretion system sortase PorU [Muribaculaceae bacterium]
MMHKTNLTTMAAALFLAMTTLMTHALPLSHFTNQSRLANGHWVKIAVTETGMHQITLEQLIQMGFDGTSNIQVYGYGGKMLDEVLNDDLPDDLQQIPVLRNADKICFYASGPVSYSLEATPKPHYKHSRNTYSVKAYYLLTQSNSGNANLTTQSFNSQSNPQLVNTSLDALLHEKELVSAGFTGSELLGEDLGHSFDFQLINPSDTRLGLTSRVAAQVVRKKSGSNISVSGKLACRLTVAGQVIDVPYSTNASTIQGSTATYTFYQVNPDVDQYMVWMDLPDTCHNGTLNYSVSVVPNDEEAVLHLNKLDYFTVTYNHYNRLDGHQGAQCMMGLVQSAANDIVQVQGNGILVWDVTNPASPMMMQTRTVGQYTQFTPGATSTPRQYVAFDPTSTLHELAGYEVIENQNLHGLTTPDMLIITNHEFMQQAQRVANLHKLKDHMEVLVLDQEQVFNEFSGGTPDAMAIRLLCKMFYDRNPNRFKYLLLFGNFSFDNRGLVTGKQNLIVSYVSPKSNAESSSYINDDFYGYLLDGSGQKISSDVLCLGIGHMPVANTTEAAEAVDKLYGYVYSTDYGPWRNNYSLWAENSAFKEEGPLVKRNAEGDTLYFEYQMHESQAAGIGYIIDNDAKTQMIRDMAFVRMFPLKLSESYKEEKKRSSDEATRHIQEMFNEGQYFATYVGHAGATSMSVTGLWTSKHVQNNAYSRLPIMTTACCDVARFDSDERGMAELMFHKRDGGAIALYTTSRQVIATMNDDVNRAFTTKMFSYHDTGVMPRLGDCYVASKNCYATSNTNKFNWVLLGDPALQVNYPKPLFKITAINGTQLSSSATIGVSPLQRVTIDAQVLTEWNPSQTNTHFNGEATFTIYDVERTCLEYINGTGTHKGETMSLPYPREKLLQVTGRVVNGKFHGTGIMPRFSHTGNGSMLLSVYAHEDGTENMVNGIYDQLQKNNYNASLAVNDKVSPVIQAMYLNNEQEFAANATVGPEATLYIHATDNTAFNTQQLSMGRSMRLTLDGGKTSYNLAKDLAKVSNEGRKLDIAMPLNSLTAGRHTLDFTVSDVCGNTTTQHINFVVSSQSNLRLQASDIANSNEVSIDLTDFSLTNPPLVNLRVTDINGNLVWSKQTDTFPCTWNLKNNTGQRVPDGLYHIYGNYSNGEGYGGSNLIDFVVLPALSN